MYICTPPLWKQRTYHSAIAFSFLEKGVKQVNMDEVANNLGISKKTLYVHFDNKQDLVHHCFQAQNLVSEMINTSAAQFDNAIDDFLQLMRVVLWL